MKITLAEIALAVTAWQQGDVSGTSLVAGIGTDTRQELTGQLFVALRGEQHDGHQHLAAARASGALAALVDEAAWQAHAGFPELAGWPLLVVRDTRLALGRLAASWRAQHQLPLIALTGSNGKTTTKEMIAAILRAAWPANGEAEGDAESGSESAAEPILATRGNFNNDIGLPLTLLGLHAGHRAAVVEMGMNHPGEIRALTELARPTVALVTNAQRAHLQGLGSLTAIAEEKGSIYAGLRPDGIAVIAADDPHAALWRAANAGRRMVSFGFQPGADVGGKVVLHGLDTRLEVTTKQGSFSVALAVPGRHNAANALAACAATLAAGVSLTAIVTGLNRFTGVPGRLARRPGRDGALILDDTYNANPDSVRAGIDVLAGTIGGKIVVLGDMGEIGEASGQFHDEIGGYAKSSGIDRLFTLGEASAIATRNFGEGGQHFTALEALLASLLPLLSPGVTVLVKGSRFMRMERVVAALAPIEKGQD